jgi:hypothetical protein
MVLQLVMPDVVKMAVAFLRAQPEVVALCGAPTSIRGKLIKNTVYPAVRITRISDEPVMVQPFYIEAVRVQFDCYGGNNRQAERLAQAVRNVLMHRAVNHQNDEGVIVKVVPRGMSDTPDETQTPARERYILELEMHVRPL